ncbi:hypothetical protein [Nostoc sp. 'Lobaria pulmonaria (5183) cyanobiont']|uniref:hypothetical protein n=1 Tax=Nostoc sp. 'Lobaria pulmonaria (5183) cyanobiont' TaxID=1618022 RepID=UPI000CF33238|nr:hypothetical protein [Nostoc sp. 'Lobaria pulmonaria (5183) cyanobiont']
MATIKISELPESQLEKLSDADLRLVNGGGSGFQISLGGTALSTGVNIGPGRIENATASTGSLQGGAGSPFIVATFATNAVSLSFPS